MPVFDCDDPAVTDALHALHATVAARGGRLAPGARLMAHDGGLWVESPPPPDAGAPQLQVPESALPAVERFTIGVRGDAFRRLDHDRGLAPARVAACDRVLALFNLLDKPARHRAESPWFTVAAHLLETLVAARRGNSRLEHRLALHRAGDTERLLVDTFMGARTVGIPPRGDDPGGQALMPFIDFLNHHDRAPPYQLADAREGERILWTARSQPAAGTEVFVRYTTLDALDSLLVYGFHDTSAPWVRSVATTVWPLADLPLTVDGRIATPWRGPLPLPLTRLRPWMPQIPACDADGIRLSHLFLAGADDTTTAPAAARRLLAALVHTARPDLPRDATDRAADDAVDALLAINDRFYADLEKRTAHRADPGAAAVHRMATEQRARLAAHTGGNPA